MRACVIGAGAVGLMCAWRLQARGVDVVVVDAQEPAREASYAAAGILAPQCDAERDDAWFSFALKSRELHARFADELGVPLLRTGAAYLALDALQAASLHKRIAWQRQRGLSAEWYDDARALVPAAAEDLAGAAWFANEASLDPRALTAALLARVSVRANAPVARIDAGQVVLASGETIAADTIVIAAGAWASRIPGGDPRVPENAIEPVRGVLLLLEWEALDRIVYWRGGYLVPRSERRVIFGASSEPSGFDKTITEEAVAGIEARGQRALPSLKQARVIDRWSGLRPFARRERPIISASSVPGLVYATGLYRNGILLAPATAEAITALVLDGVAPDPTFAL